MADFLDELTGDLVIHLRSLAGVSALVGSSTAARIFPDMARQGAALPYIVYTQVAGVVHKSHAGRTGCKELILNLYCYGSTQPAARALANLIEPYMLDTLGVIGNGTKIHVCNGSIVDSGVEAAANSSDVKKFWVRLVLRLLIG